MNEETGKRKIIELEVAGEPQSLKRHRSFRVGNGIRQYDPSKGSKQDFLAIAHANKPDAPLDVPLEVHLEFQFSRPKSHYRTGKNAHLLKESAPKYHTKVPDNDNLLKFVCDALNKVFWRDDAVIARTIVTKVYSETPKTIMTVYALES